MRFDYGKTKTTTMGETVYALCAITSALCALLLVRAYCRTRVRFLLWATVCFVALFVQNVLLFVDLVILPNIDLSVARALVGASGLVTLLFGVVSDAE